jgi:hypothetical protein
METSTSSKKMEKNENIGKKRKKSKKSNDMPRRALSAYNIFFSEQRMVILKEIDERELTLVKDTGDADNNDEDNDHEKPKSEDDDKAVNYEMKKADDAKKVMEDHNSEEKDEGDAVAPKVLNRTFFPKHSKRAHRQVHGKIGLVELAREVSKRWKDLDAETKKKYKDLAAEDRKKHKKGMAEYQERKAAENMVSIGASDSTDEEDGVDEGFSGVKKDKAATTGQESRRVKCCGVMLCWGKLFCWISGFASSKTTNTFSQFAQIGNECHDKGAPTP